MELEAERWLILQSNFFFQSNSQIKLPFRFIFKHMLLIASVALLLVARVMSLLSDRGFEIGDSKPDL